MKVAQISKQTLTKVNLAQIDTVQRLRILDVFQLIIM